MKLSRDRRCKSGLISLPVLMALELYRLRLVGQPASSDGEAGHVEVRIIKTNTRKDTRPTALGKQVHLWLRKSLRKNVLTVKLVIR